MPTPFPTPVTADLIAVAIIAAARVYGDNPEKTLTGGGGQRRALAPALCAVANQTGQPIKRLCRMTGIYASNVSTARRYATPAFSDAMTAAGSVLLKDALQRSAAVKRPLRLIVQRAEPPSPLTMTGRVLKVICERPLPAPTMAIVLGTKETEVTTALSILRQQGRAEPGETPPEGERWRVWRAVAEQVAA